MFPLNRTGDQEGCTWEDGTVRTPSGFGDAYRAYVEGGWGGLTCNPEFGGLPHTLSVFVEEMLQSSNMALSLYATARFFVRRLLPNTASLLLTLRAGADTVIGDGSRGVLSRGHLKLVR